MAIDLNNHKHLFNVENDTELQELQNQLTDDNKPYVIYDKSTGDCVFRPEAQYTINLNNAWQLSTTLSNPNTSLYDGVYESYSNKGVDDSYAEMMITIVGYSNFKLYIRSYAESSYDYVMVSKLDKPIDNHSLNSNPNDIKATTQDNQTSGNSINNYTLVEFSDIDYGEHVIYIIYRKDSSVNENDDCGYVLIPKNQ